MSTDFFQQQDTARRKTGTLVVLFLLAVVAIVLAIYLLVVAILAMIPVGGPEAQPKAPVRWEPAQPLAPGPPGRQLVVKNGKAYEVEVPQPGPRGIPEPVAQGPRARVPPASASLWQPAVFLWVSLGTLIVIALGSLYKIAELSAGGESVALMLGGRLVDPHTKELAERRVLNVVEEMALASGVPVPPVYVLDDERSINAFAAGHTPGNAVIGVSRGALTYLTRDELQGVMAHEFSHILNGDMRLNLRLIGTLNGILILAILGYYLMRGAGSSSGDSKDNGRGRLALFLAGLGLLVIGYIGVIFGKLIKAAVSRQREYLADASAVQFTRYPGGIAGALKKIGGLAEGSRIKDGHAEECSHLFFGDAFAGSLFNLLSTHPPLADRIQRIDPSFDGTFPEVEPVATAEIAAAEAAVPGEAIRPAPGEMRTAAEDFRAAAEKRRRGMSAKAVTLDPTGITGRIGLPGVAQIAFASALLEAMTAPVRDASREPYSARAVIYALLLNREEDVRQRQLADLKTRTEELCYRETLQMAAEVDRMAEEARLPLVDVTVPALKRLSPDQYTAFRQTVEALVAADGKMDLFEYVVRAVILKYLDVHFGLSQPPTVRYRALTPLVPAMGTVFSTLAYAGQESPADAQHALDQAAAAVGQPLALLPSEQCSLDAFDAAMGELAQATPQVKKRIIGAAAACVVADGKVTVKEGELLRVISALLGCPMPPLAAEVESGGTARPSGDA
jgi:Zn-dependent protease with chaperone function